MAAETVWTREEETELRRMFDEGLSYGRIARTLGHSKNATTSKLHRMGLHRDSIVAHTRQASIARAGKTTLPPLPSLTATNDTQ